MFAPVRLLPFSYLHPLFPFTAFFPFPLSLTFFPPEVPPWKCDRSYSLLCCIAFARGHRETAENLCRYSRPFNRVYPQSTVCEKITSHSAFQYARYGLAVTHPSTEPPPSYLTWMTAWYQTPTTRRRLSVIIIIIIYNLSTTITTTGKPQQISVVNWPDN